jgi:poly(A) polymerase/tRNA nucleotidyltransferase (CCA-adding enzyme)
MQLFRRTIPTGVKHGTVTVLSRGQAVEVTTFRSDGKYSDARHPDSVTYAKTILEDLSRRDFTINGIAYNPINDTLVDPYGGKGDIEKKIIRTIGDPVERFNEDGLRPYRACRFAAQLHFSIENNTAKAIGASFESAGEVSAERIRDEFIKIIQSEKPSIGIELLRITGLLELFLPEILTGFGINQNVYHRFDIYYHNLYTCDAADPGDYRVRLAALFHDIGKYYAKREIEGRHKGKKSVFYNHEIIGAGITKRIMRRLRFSNNDIKMVIHLIRNHMFHYTYLWTDGAVRRFMRKVGLDNIDSLFELRRADRIGNGLKRGESKAVENLKVRIDKIIEQENAITVKDLALNGYDIMREFNLKPGPLIGKILNHLLEEILDDPSKNTRETLINLASVFLQKEKLYIKG